VPARHQKLEAATLQSRLCDLGVPVPNLFTPGLAGRSYAILDRVVDDEYVGTEAGDRASDAAALTIPPALVPGASLPRNCISVNATRVNATRPVRPQPVQARRDQVMLALLVKRPA
jgi:hypothetical protein